VLGGMGKPCLSPVYSFANWQQISAVNHRKVTACKSQRSEKSAESADFVKNDRIEVELFEKAL
jgi:hypothetical protein